MVHSSESSTYRGIERYPGDPALALRTQTMTISLASVETREVVRCDYCSLVQYRTSNSLCRKCHRPLDIPTLGSLERLADALEVNVCQLVRDSRSRREEEVNAILSDPFLAELAALLPQLDPLHRTLFYGSLRDMATGRRRTA